MLLLACVLKAKSISKSPRSPQRKRQVRNKLAKGKSPLCLLCRVVSQIPLQRLFACLLRTCRADMCATSPQLPVEVTAKRV